MAKRTKYSIDNRRTEPQKPQLNVIFHGPFLFIFYERRVEAVTPYMNEHLCGAGEWLDEIACYQGAYYLTGVVPGKTAPSIEARSHAKVKAQDCDIDLGASPNCRFVLPFPFQMKPLGLMNITNQTVFVGDYAKHITAKELGRVHVLSYPLDPEATPQLENLAWVPKFSPYYPFAINLHVYAESVFRRDPDHPVRDFQKALTMLPKLSLGLGRPFPDLKTPDPLPNGDLGITREEQGGLRGLPPKPPKKFKPPLLCDAPSLVVTGAQDPKP
jgi:hypothetical protein